ncbi:MAG: ABC transporter ATP-binding protein [Gemmatimonadales bacterium]|nr:ABC transporter ATP-binding protein [Gemmatimonadales bacterium]
MSGLRLDGVTFTYPGAPAPALRDCDLAVEPGTLTWLRGEVGAGCSTLLLVAAGLAPRHTGGTLTGRVTRAGTLGYVGAEPRTQLSGVADTVFAEVAFAPQNLGWPADDIVRATWASLDRFGLVPLAGRHPEQLSGGEQQRLLLAALDVLAPDVWLLDEPTAALDAEWRERVEQWMRDEAGRGAAVLVADGRTGGQADGDAASGPPAREVMLEAGRVWQPHPAAASPRASSPRAAVPVRPSARPPVRLKLADASFRYAPDRPVLDALSLEVLAGEVLLVLGPNGAGKSTLLRLVTALAHPVSGSVTSAGRDTRGRGPEDLADVVGTAVQDPGVQLFERTVRRELAWGPRVLGWPRERAAARAEEVLARLGLEAAAESHPLDLPLPLRKRVALGTALMVTPQLLVLDEPTAGTDPATRDLVAQAIHEEASRGAAVICVTHDAWLREVVGGRELVLGRRES